MSNASIIRDLADGKAISDASAAIAPLLEAMHWLGTTRQMAEAATASWSTADISDIRNTMAHLNFTSNALKTRVRNIDKRLLPCLFEGSSGKIFVIHQKAGELVAFDAQKRETVAKVSGLMKGTAYFFEPDDGTATAGSKAGWFRPIARRFEPFAFRLIIMSLVISVLALATPLFVKAVFDQVIGAKSLSTLNFLAIGVGLALLCHALISYMRATLLS